MTRRSEARGASLRRGASLPSAAPPLPDEELIQLPPGALVALAKLQDPDGFQRIMQKGSMTPSASREGQCSEGWEECVGSIRTPGKCEFVIYEDGAVTLPSRGFSPIPNSAPMSPTPVKGRGPLSPAAGRCAVVKDCPLPPPPTPSPEIDIPEVAVSSTPPPLGRYNFSSARKLAFESGSQAAWNSRTKKETREIQVASTAEVLRDSGNLIDPSSSWNGLVQLSDTKRLQARGAKSSESHVQGDDSKERRQFKLAARTPPSGNRPRGKENNDVIQCGRRETPSKSLGINQQRQLLFSPECREEEISTPASAFTSTSLTRRKVCCPCT